MAPTYACRPYYQRRIRMNVATHQEKKENEKTGKREAARSLDSCLEF